MMEKIIEKKINLPSSFDPRQFWGADETVLLALQDAFPVKIIPRGHMIKIIGPGDTVALIVTLLEDLILSFKETGFLSSQDVATAIRIASTSLDRTPTPADKSQLNYSEIIPLEQKFIQAKSSGQHELIQALQKNDIVFAIGPAGTGKTYLSVAMAVSAFNQGGIKKIILARPAVEAGESLGFLPGDYKDKIDPYLKPLYDALEEMLSFQKLKRLLDQEIIEIIPLAYMRGRTLNNAFIILDEAQNTTFTQMKMFLTRLGFNAKAVITGDITQIDLPHKKDSGLISSIRVLNGISGIRFVYLHKNDVVRHALVKDIIEAYDKFDRKENGSENQ